MNYTICGHILDNNQQQIVKDNSNHLLVIAGAGSGKTLTIIGKVKHLVERQKIKPSEILCISFTNAACRSLQDKISKELSYDVPVYTFHKLSLQILKERNLHYDITDPLLLENIVHEFFVNYILESPILMKNVLRYFKIQKIYNIKEQYISFCYKNAHCVNNLEKLLITFLKLFKCNNYKIENFADFMKRKYKIFKFNKRHEQIVLLLALNIYLIYDNYLQNNNEIDFDDMIIKATNNVINNKLVKKFKYIIIDEYQDTSYIRFLLIKSILDYTSAKLMVVGDDYQSIYRFNGCDVSLFVNFKNFFPTAKILQIENTYRNSMPLISVANNFITKNKNQIKKDLKSNKMCDHPIKIVFYNDLKEKIIHIIVDIYQNSKEPIMILGRNNNDINMILSEKLQYKNNKIIYCNNKDIDIYYLTVHKAKGLEEENVIIINLIDNINGFPCQIRNDRLLRFVEKNKEHYPYSEERRLFYVALTRTKNNVYLLTPYKNSSIFVKELIADKYHYGKMVKIIK